MLRRPFALLAVAAMAATLVAADHETEHGGGDAVVIAVIDGSYSPYHWDFLGSKMPQHLDPDPSNDLPLDRPAYEWLHGFPEDPSEAFSSYTEMPLTLADDPNANVTALRNADGALWDALPRSTASEHHLAWVPGSKIIGLVDFGGLGPSFAAGNGSHGGNTSSVSTGNLHGTCPECLVVLITYDACAIGTPPGECPQYENALNWVMQQTWIDAVTNSYGFSLGVRDRYYDGKNAAAQAEASERGQTILYSAGNGQAGDFSVPNTTLWSSQEGPDWTITVGATSPTGYSYSGAGKPADVSSIGNSYPSLGGSTVTGTDRTFGGTSNATPVVAGYYGRSLYEARRALSGPSRSQLDGTIAVGDPLACGEARPDCELGDGILTAAELRHRLLKGAVHTAGGTAVGTSLIGSYRSIDQKTDETEFLAEGHGTYFGRLTGDELWMEELGNITGPLFGTAPELARPDGEAEWFVVDSYCRQLIWGQWSDGYHVEGETSLPGPDPLWPIRSAYQHGCPDALAPPFL